MRLHFYDSGPACDVVGEELTKENMLKKACISYGMPLEKMLYIGDSSNDLEAIAAAGYCGCPANSQNEVKQYVRKRKGFVSRKVMTEGCLRALEKYSCKNLFAVISDVDGCLYARGKSTPEDLAKVAAYIRGCTGFFTAKPPLTICTGRSYEQSCSNTAKFEHYSVPVDLITAFGFTKGNIPSWLLESWPPLMFENASVLYHVHSGVVENVLWAAKEYRECIAAVKRAFFERASELSVLSPEGIKSPPKRNLFTIDIPLELRGTEKGKEFSKDVFLIIQDICNKLGVEVEER